MLRVLHLKFTKNSGRIMLLTAILVGGLTAPIRSAAIVWAHNTSTYMMQVTKQSPAFEVEHRSLLRWCSQRNSTSLLKNARSRLRFRLRSCKF
jgi:hypothetical protein